MFSEKGYTAIEIDIDAGSDKALGPMVSELAHQIRLLAIPYPPLIFAQGSSTLLSQSFISDHPASGLILIDPISPPEGVEEFTYESTFPILVLASEAKEAELRNGFRLLTNFKGGPGRGGRGVSVEIAKDVRSHEARTVSRCISVADGRMWSDGWIDAGINRSCDSMHVYLPSLLRCARVACQCQSGFNKAQRTPPFASSCTCAWRSSFASCA